MIFIDNKYTRIYYNIINRAKTRNLSSYKEKHHIIPKSLGGDNSKSNIVELTAKEHFICHLLLTKMTKGMNKKKMVCAVFYLTGKGKSLRNNSVIGSKLYENLRTVLSSYVSEQKRGCKQPPRTLIARQRYSKSKTGKNNPRFKGIYVTPWGTYESSKLAAISCPLKISSVAIINFCKSKNKIPISFLSVCRSDGFLNRSHLGLTPEQIGFGFLVNT